MLYILIIFSVPIVIGAIKIIIEIITLKKQIKKDILDDSNNITMESYEKKERTSVLKNIGIFFLLFFVVGGISLIPMIISMNSYEKTSSYKSSSEYNDVVNIKYEIQSPSTVNITYENSTGNTSQLIESNEKTIYVQAEEGDFYYISVQNNDDHGGIHINMYVDGSLVASNSSDGAYCIADLSGSVE